MRPASCEVVASPPSSPGARLVFTHGFTRSPRAAAFCATRPAPSITDGFEVLVQLVMAAITTEPCAARRAAPFISTGTAVVGDRRLALQVVVQRRLPRRLRRAQRDAVLRALRPRELGSTVARSSSSVSLNSGVGVSARPEEALRLAVRLDQRDVRRRRGRTAAGRRASRRRPGRSRWSRRTRAPCWRWSRDRRAAGCASPGPKNSTNFPTTPFLRSISVTVSTRSVAVAPSRSVAVQAEADDLRDQHDRRLAQHGRLGLDAADAPADDAEAVDHGGVRVGAEHGVGKDHRLAVRCPGCTTTGARYSRFTWCTMPVPGGTTRKSRNARCPQRRNA